MSMLSSKIKNEQDEKEDEEQCKKIQQKMQYFFSPYEEFIKIMDRDQTWQLENIERKKVMGILSLSKENAQKKCVYSTLLRTYDMLSIFYNKVIQPFFQRQKSAKAKKKNIKQTHVAVLDITSSNEVKVSFDFLENKDRSAEIVNLDAEENDDIIILDKEPKPPIPSTQEYQRRPKTTADSRKVPLQNHVVSLPHARTSVSDMRRGMDEAKSQTWHRKSDFEKRNHEKNQLRSSSNSRLKEHDYTQQFSRSWNSGRTNDTAPDNYEKSSIMKKKPHHPLSPSEYSSFDRSRPKSYSRNSVERTSTISSPPIHFSEFPPSSNYTIPASSSNDIIPPTQSLTLRDTPPFRPNLGPSPSISEPSRSMFIQPQQEMNIDWRATVPTQHSNTPFMPTMPPSWDMPATQPLMANTISRDSLPMDYRNSVGNQYVAQQPVAALFNYLAPEPAAQVPHNQFHYQTSPTELQQPLPLLNYSNTHGLRNQMNSNIPGMNSHDIGNYEDRFFEGRNFQESRSVPNRDLRKQPDPIANGDHSYQPNRDIRTVQYPQQEANPQATSSSNPEKNYNVRNFESRRREQRFQKPKDWNRESQDLGDTTEKNIVKEKPATILSPLDNLYSDETVKTGVGYGTQKKTFFKKKNNQTLPTPSSLPVFSKPSISVDQHRSQTETEVSHTPENMEFLGNNELSDEMCEKIKKFVEKYYRELGKNKLNETDDEKAREKKSVDKSDNSDDDSVDKFPEKATESIKKTTTRKENGIPESTKNSSEFGPKSKTKHVENPNDTSKSELNKLIFDKQPRIVLKKIDTPLQCDNACQDINNEMNNEQDNSYEKMKSSISDRLTRRTKKTPGKETKNKKKSGVDGNQKLTGKKRKNTEQTAEKSKKGKSEKKKTIPGKVSEEPKSSESDKDPSLSLEQVRAYVWGSSWNCIYCSFSGKNLVQHFVTKHPTKEVMISRLSEQVAKDCTEETTKFVANPEQIILQYRCRFCSLEITHDIPRISTVNFYEHCTLHTGEYVYRCTECHFRATEEIIARSHFYNECRKLKNSTKSIDDAVKKVHISHETEVYGYICSKCNFVQLQEDNLNEHVKKCRSEDLDAVVIRISMSLQIKADECTKPDSNAPTMPSFDPELLKATFVKKEKIEPEEVDDNPVEKIKEEPVEEVMEVSNMCHDDCNTGNIKTEVSAESGVGLAESGSENQPQELLQPETEVGLLYPFLGNFVCPPDEEESEEEDEM